MKSKDTIIQELIQENREFRGKIRELESLEKKQALTNKTLIDKTRQLALIEKHMIDCISQVDTSGNFLYLSPSNEQLFGYKPENLIGKNAFDFFHPDDLPTVRAEFQRHVQSAQTGRIEFRFLCADGKYLWIETMGSFVRDESGEVAYIVLASRTIEDRKNLEAVNREREQLMDLITNNMTDLISITDKNGVLVYVSPSHKIIWGYENNGLLGRTPLEIVHPDDLKIITEKFLQMFFEKKHRQLNLDTEVTAANIYQWNASAVFFSTIMETLTAQY